MSDKLVVYSVYGLVVLVLLGVATVACERIYEKFSIPVDNPIEEFAEDLIEEHLDLPENTIDLTPKQK